MKLIYVYDALCGWCYGFSPVMEKFYETYKNELDFEVVSGGMITGDRIGPIGEVASYIGEAYKDVEQRTGVRFGSDFLEGTLKDGSAIFTSIPAAIAMSIYKESGKTESIRFAAALQKAIYFDGIAPMDYDAYGKIAQDFGFDQKEFVSKMNNSKFAQLADKDFQKSAALSVSGFPSVFIENEETFYKIGAGYMPFADLQRNYESVKNR